MTIARLILVVSLFSLPAFGDTYSWSGKAEDGQWANPANWVPSNAAPASGDSVTISGPGSPVTLNSALSLANVNISSAILNGAGALTVTAQGTLAYAQFNLSSVTISAPTDIFPGPGADVETTIGCSFINSSTITVHGNAEFVVNSGVRAVNQGIWYFTPASTLSLPDQPGAVTFLNNGSLYLTNMTIDTAGGNGSILSNASGGLIFSQQTNTVNGVIANGGTIQTATNSVFMVADDSTFYLFDGSTLTGPGVVFINCPAFVTGKVLVTGGLQFLTDQNNSPTTLTINGLLEIGNNGLFNWYGGSLSGAGTNITGAVQVDLQGALYILNDLNGMSLKNIVLMNNGFVYWTNNGTLYLANNARIVNQLTFYISGDSALSQLMGDTSFVAFTNSSLVIKNFGAITAAATAIRVPFYDGGNVEVSQGNLQLYGGGLINQWTAGAAGTITFQDGTFTARPLANLTSGGPITLNSGALINVPQYALLGIEANFFHSGGTIFGGGKVIVAGGLAQGVYQWNAGTISITNSSSAVSIEQGGIMNIEGANNTKNLLWGVLLNSGIINWTNDNSVGGINLGDLAAILNQAQFNLQCDAYMNDTSTNTSSAPVFVNAAGALVAKTANTGTTTLNVRFSDAGTVRAQSGTIEFLQFADNYPNSPLSIIVLAGGKVQFDTNEAIHANISGSGQIIAQKGLTLSGGSLTVIAISISGNATNDETFDLSSFGTLTFNGGNFTQTANGTLIIPAQSTNSGGYGKVTGAGNVTLSGTLDGQLTYGAAPAVGASFPFLTCGQLSNTFATVLLPQGLTVKYTANSASIVVTNDVPAILGSLTMVTNTFEFGFATVSNDLYTVQFATNIAPPIQWTEMTNFFATTTNTVFTIPFQTNSLEFFRVGHSTPR
jgi:hypothetical protein